MTTFHKLDDAIDHLAAEADKRIAQLTKQRDDLAQCLHDIVRAIERGDYVIRMDKIQEGMGLLNHAQGALCHQDIYVRLEAAADARAKEGTARHD